MSGEPKTIDPLKVAYHRTLTSLMNMAAENERLRGLLFWSIGANIGLVSLVIFTLCKAYGVF